MQYDFSGLKLLMAFGRMKFRQKVEIFQSGFSQNSELLPNPGKLGFIEIYVAVFDRNHEYGLF